MFFAFAYGNIDLDLQFFQKVTSLDNTASLACKPLLLWLCTGIKCGTPVGALNGKHCFFWSAYVWDRTPDISITAYCSGVRTTRASPNFFFPAKSFWCWIILCIYGIIWKRASRKNQIFFSYFFPSLHFRKVKRSFRIFLVKWKHCPWQICQKKTSKSSWSSWELMCWQRTTVLWTKSFPEQKLHHERCENRMQLLRRLKIFFPYISRTLTFLSCSFWTLIFHTDLCRLFFLDCIFL